MDKNNNHNNNNGNKINRRDFFKLAGAGTLASAAALYGCSGKTTVRTANRPLWARFLPIRWSTAPILLRATVYRY